LYCTAFAVFLQLPRHTIFVCCCCLSSFSRVARTCVCWAHTSLCAYVLVCCVPGGGGGG
jgi:hypothetical protein